MNTVLILLIPQHLLPIYSKTINTMNVFTDNIENYDDNYGVDVNDVNDIAMDIDYIEIDLNSVTSLTTCSTSNQSISGATSKTVIEITSEFTSEFINEVQF